MADKDDALRTELKETKKKLKETERELARKDKALAEFAALVALKKKQMRSGGTARTTDPRSRPDPCRQPHQMMQAWDRGCGSGGSIHNTLLFGSRK